MMAVLRLTVMLTDENAKLHTFPAGTTPPEWARKRITNPAAWDNTPDTSLAALKVTADQLAALAVTADTLPVPGQAPTGATSPPDDDPGAGDGGDGAPSVPQEAPRPPAKSGPGSGKDAWAAYAALHQVEVAAGASREEIIAAVQAAGVPIE